MPQILRLLLLVWVVFSCSNERFEAHQSAILEDQIIFESGELYQLALDSVTPTLTNYIELYQAEISYLVMLNHHDNSLILYDKEKGEVLNKIFISQEGPNSVGPAESFLILNNDSILVVSDRLEAGFYTWGGKLIDKFSRYETDIALTPVTTTGNPPVLRNKLLFQSGFYMGSDNHDLTLVCSVERDSCFTTFRIPDIYRSGKWGPGEFDLHFHAYNDEEELFVYSFPPASDVYVTDHRNRNTVHFAGSKYFGDIHPLPRATKGRKEILNETLLRPIYQEIIYDKYRDLYYRVAEHPLATHELDLIADPYAPGVRDFSVIVLNGAFERIGESEIIGRNQFDTRIFFVDERGLFLKQMNNENEDYMIFQGFTAITNQ